MEDLASYDFIQNLKALPFVEEIWLFGSRARGDATERSDIDLAILCSNANDEDWSKVLHIQEHADTLLKIDCVRFDILKQSDPLRSNILRFKQVIYKRNDVMTEIFWKDYFDTLGDAIKRLADVINHPDVQKNDYMQDAAIQRFEFVIELFWKVMKKILTYEKLDAVTPREVLNKSYQFSLINDEKIWLKMLDDRNATSHVYKQEIATRVFNNIGEYLPVLQLTYAQLKAKYNL